MTMNRAIVAAQVAYGWMQNPAWQADALHFLGGWGVVAGAAACGGNWTAFAVWMILFAIVKEFVIDILFEKTPPQTFMDGLRDFAGYCVGVGLASILIWRLT